MVGVPALWQLLERKIYKNVADARRRWSSGRSTRSSTSTGRCATSCRGTSAAGKLLFYPVHRKLGGRLRLLIRGGSALPPETMKAFRGLGFNLLRGLRHDRGRAGAHRDPARRQALIPGSVGRALPGIDVRIDQPDERGIGEVVAKGPNVMLGYFENAEATGADASSTAGSTPATWAGSTTTATSSSSAARRR